MYYPLNRRWT